MIERCFALAGLLALMACTEPQPDNAPSSGSDTNTAADGVPSQAGPVRGEPVTTPGQLIGEYRVADIDGRPADEMQGLDLSIDGALVSYEPTCLGFIWKIEIDGNEIAFERQGRPVPEPRPGSGELAPPPPPVCAVAVPPQWNELATALDSVDRATRTPENSILLTGGGHSITLLIR